MANNNLIPFTKELWDSGEYKAVTFTGITKVTIYEIENDIIYGRVEDNLTTWTIEGANIGNTYIDLMLQKKIKKVWIPILQDDWFETKEEAEKIGKEHWAFIKVIEVEI